MTTTEISPEWTQATIAERIGQTLIRDVTRALDAGNDWPPSAVAHEASLWFRSMADPPTRATLVQVFQTAVVALDDVPEPQYRDARRLVASFAQTEESEAYAWVLEDLLRGVLWSLLGTPWQIDIGKFVILPPEAPCVRVLRWWGFRARDSWGDAPHATVC